MIIWLNGAFGAGKTTAAFELCRRLPDSFVYDPENVGFFLRKNMPPVCHTPDFQDMPLWRSFNFQLLKELHAHYNGPVIVPMTLVSPAYHQEILGRLADEDVPVSHIILSARRETIHKRLKKRSLGRLGSESFAVEAIGRCQDFFDRHEAGSKIMTDGLSVSEVVEEIAVICGLSLTPERRGRLARGMDRLQTAFRHIRL